MELYTHILIFIFGSIIGSFLNVVIYRLHTGKSLNGRSHCMSCGKTLVWFELFPILSYLFLRGKCRSCLSYIPSRYLIVELLTGLSFVLTYTIFQRDAFLLIVHLILVSVLMIVVVYDIRHTIIPNEMSALVGIIALVLLGYEWIIHRDPTTLLENVGAGIAAFIFFGGLWFVSRGRWIGFGDAKIALPLGIIVGLSGAFSMVVFSFWIGAIISLSLLGIEKMLRKGKTYLHFLSIPLTMKSEVPFAPFLILGFLAVHFFHADILQLTRIFFE